MISINEKSTQKPDEISSDAPKSLKSIAPDENKKKFKALIINRKTAMNMFNV
ncbi:cell surface antigen domain protein [Orientia tsutsugamushi str. UT76]|nr:cell surface antigen domain protein [Orientia tsutsugamushi str. UT76]